MKCWICGVEPEQIEVTTLGVAQPRYVDGPWPSGDHIHEVQPTPAQLAERGDEAFNEATVGVWIRDQWHGER